MSEEELTFPANMTNATTERCSELPGKYIHMAAYCAVFALALAGNILLILSVRNNKRLWSSSNYLIVNMSSSDVILPIIALPRMIVEVLQGRETWLLSGTLGLVSCKLVYFLQDVSTAVSVQSLVVITVERFCAVVFPLRASTLIQPKVKFIIPVTWAIAFSLHAVYFKTLHLCEMDSGKLLCCQKWPSQQSQAIYFVLVLSLVFALPLLLMVVMYTLIIIRLRRRKFPEHHSASRRRREIRQERQNRHILKLAVVIVAAFFLCFSPVVTFAVIRATGAVKFTNKCGVETYRSVAKFLSQSNCAVNPIICYVFNSHFRREFQRYIAMIFCCGRRKAGYRDRLDTLSLRRQAARDSSLKGSLKRPADGQDDKNGLGAVAKAKQPLLQETAAKQQSKNGPERETIL